MNKLPKVNGITIKLYDKDYVLPPLPVKAFSKGDASEKLKAIQDELTSANGGIAGITQDSVQNVISLVTIALQRNYPDITEEEVEDGLYDIVDLLQSVQYLISQNKSVQKQLAEARKNVLKASETE